MQTSFSGELWYWRGPSPFYFVTVPESQCADIQELSRSVTYGWGMIPVTVTLGSSTWQTSLFPKDGRYLVPVKARIRRTEQVDEGDVLTLHLAVTSPTRPGGA